MDSGAESTQRLVISLAIVLALVIVLIIGYSLYSKAKTAEGELANKIELDSQTKKANQDAKISLTGESKNSSNFSYDGLVQKKNNDATTTNFEIVNEQTPVEVPPEPTSTPDEDAVPPEEPIEDEGSTTPVTTTPPKPVDDDRPLTLEEIQAIRQLPVDNSPAGNLQTSLEEESQGQYKARY